MKTGRVVGVDDAPFVRGRDRYTCLVFTVMKGSVVEGFLSGEIEVDGRDALGVIADKVGEVSGVTSIMLSGSVFGGTNYVDPDELYERTGIPVIVVSEKKPKESFYRLFPHSRHRLHPLETSKGTLYVYSSGLENPLPVIERYQLSSKLPEPLRLSHLVGRVVRCGGT